MLTFDTTVAMAIAQVDRIKFNEMVALKHYHCAPTADGKKARDFDEDDLIALTVFGEAMKLYLSAPRAAVVACAAHNHLQSDGHELLAIVHAFDWRLGAWWTAPFFGEGLDKGRPYINPAETKGALVFSIPAIRRHIAEAVENIRATGGK